IQRTSELDLYSFLCPISRKPMEDPVLAMDGHTYDRLSIEKWLAKSDKSPVSNVTLDSKQLIPNFNLKRQIRILYVDIQKLFEVKMNFFANFPEELLFCVFQYLDAVALARCAQVRPVHTCLNITHVLQTCQRWYHVSQDSSLWKALLEKDFHSH